MTNPMPFPTVTMRECRIKTNMYRELLFTVNLPHYTWVEYNERRATVILPTGMHLSYGLWEGGTPTVLVNGPGSDKLMKALRTLKETGSPFNRIDPVSFIHHRLVEQLKEDLEHPRHPYYVVKLMGLPRRMADYESHPERKRIAASWRGAWVKPYGKVRGNEISVSLYGTSACGSVELDELEGPLDMAQVERNTKAMRY
jgi:hypothetical protein